MKNRITLRLFKIISIICVIVLILFASEIIRWYKIKYIGSISEYYKIQMEYVDNNIFDYEFLEYALIMANDHNYEPAYMDVYNALYEKQELYKDSIYTLDSLTENERKIALQYLLKAKDNGDLESMSILGKYYLLGKYFQKDTILGEQLINESNKMFK